MSGGWWVGSMPETSGVQDTHSISGTRKIAYRPPPPSPSYALRILRIPVSFLVRPFHEPSGCPDPIQALPTKRRNTA